MAVEENNYGINQIDKLTDNHFTIRNLILYIHYKRVIYIKKTLYIGSFSD